MNCGACFSFLNPAPAPAGPGGGPGSAAPVNPPPGLGVIPAPPPLPPQSPMIPAVQHKPFLAPFPYWQLRHFSLLQRPSAKNRLVFLGDSITEGWLQAGRAIYKEKYLERYNAFNLGIGADEVQHVAWRVQDGAFDGLNPETVVILIGTNNIGVSGHKVPEVAAGIKLLLDDLRTRLPDAKLLLLGIFPRGMTADDPGRQSVAQVNEIIKNYKDDKHIFYLEFGQKFLPMTTETMPDFLHLSEKGYEIWADNMEETLVSLMKKTVDPPVGRLRGLFGGGRS